MNDLHRTWGERVSAARRGNGLTQAELAVRIGCSQQTVSDIERGQVGIRDELRIRLAQTLDLPVGELFAYPEVAA